MNRISIPLSFSKKEHIKAHIAYTSEAQKLNAQLTFTSLHTVNHLKKIFKTLQTWRTHSKRFIKFNELSFQLNENEKQDFQYLNL